MTKQEKQIQIALGTYLSNEWIECKKLFDKFHALRGTLSYEERIKFLHAGEVRFKRAVEEVYGKGMRRPLLWTIHGRSWRTCTLNNGMVFE